MASDRSATTCATSSSSDAWSDASSRCRPIEARSRRRSEAAPTQPHLLKEYVDALIRRPSTDGHQEAGRVADVERRHGERDHRHRRVLDRTQLLGRRRRDVGEQPRGRRPGGGEHDARGLEGLRRPGRPDGQPEARRRALQAADGRRGADLDTRASPRAARGSRPRPPTSPANIGGGVGRRRRQRRHGGQQRAVLAQHRDDLRRGRRARTACDAWPAYTPPSIGSASRSTTSCPSREPSSSATDTSSSPSGSTVSCRARARPSSESTPVVASASRSRGTPSSVRGRGRSAPRVQIWVDPAAGCTTSSPSSATRPTASGPTRQHRLGADVDLDPADRAEPQLAAHDR